MSKSGKWEDDFKHETKTEYSFDEYGTRPPDSRGRNLRTGESERKNGIYMYHYTDEKSGKRQTIYVRDLPELREKDILVMEQQERRFAFTCGSSVCNVYVPMNGVVA